MVAFVSGNSLGLSNSSLAVIGSQGAVGDAQAGRAGEGVFVNIATGDVVVQRQDEWVDSMGYGVETSVVRTYNSQGQFTDDNGDNWQMSVAKKLSAYVAGVSITRTDGDGAALVYTFDSGKQAYINKEGSGAFDRLTLSGSTWKWTDGSTGVKETYDATTLKIKTSSDREGNTTLYGYTGNLLTTITDAAGEVTTFAYSGNNLASITTTNKDGTTTSRVSYAYTANKLSSVTAVTSGGKTYVTTYQYNASNLLETMTQPDGSKLQFTYTANKVTQITQTLADGTVQITSLSYGTGSTTVTDPLLQQTVLSYDTSNRLSKIQYPSTATGQPSVSFSYSNTTGKLESQTDGIGNVVKYTYDATTGVQTDQRSGTTATNGTGSSIHRTFSGTTNVLLSETVYTVADPDGDGAGAPGGGLTTSYVYNATETHVHYVVSPEGRVTEYTYDSYGRRTAEIEYADRSYSGQLTEAALTTWVAGADRTKSVLTQTAYTVWNADLIKDVTRFTMVSSSGAGVVDGTESVTRFIYDPAGQLLYTIEPDKRGTTVDGIHDTRGTIHFTYDLLGRVLTKCDALGYLTTYTYDDAGNKTAIAYANGLTTTTTFDASGQPLNVVSTGSALGTTTYWYDANGRLRMSQDTTGVKSYILYDEAGRKAAYIDPNGTLTEYAYNLGNQVITQTTYATNLTSDVLAKLISGGKPANVALATVRPAASGNDRKAWNLYDAGGRLVKSVDELGYVTETVYDGASRVTKTIRYATPVVVASITSATKPSDAAVKPATNALDQTTQLFYDTDGKLTGQVAADGIVTRNEYDPAGRLRHTVTYAKSGTVSNGVLTWPAADARDIHAWFFYDNQDRLVGSVDADGIFTEFAYDPSGNKTSESVYGSTLIAPSALTMSTTLFSVRAQASAPKTTGFVYNDLNQIRTRNDPDGTVTRFTYDTTGNLLTTERTLGSSVSGHQVKVDGYGRVTNELGAAGCAALAVAGADPTQVWSQYQTTYAYDTEGRRTTMVDPNGLKTIYYYDNDGNLAYTINAAGEVTQNVYSGLEQIQQVIRYGTRLTAAAMATLSGGLLTASATTTLNIASATVDSTVTYTYANGNLVVKKDEKGNYTRYLYGSQNRLAYELDSLNNLTSYSYDVAGRLVNSTTYAKPVPTANIALNAATPLTQAMFTAALFTAITDSAQDNTSTNVYDSQGRVAYLVSGNGSVTARTYDANGNVLSETRYANPITATGTLTVASVAQALTGKTDATKDQVTYYGYDYAGRVTYQADSTGAVITSQYDTNGNLTDRHSYAVRTATPSSRTIPAEDLAHDAHERWIYDAANRVTGHAVAQTLIGGQLMWDITLNAYNDKDGQQASRQYWNALSSQTLSTTPTQAQVAAWMTSVTEDSVRDRNTSMAYDKAGRLVSATNAEGIVTQYAYDNANRVTQTTVQGATTRTVYDALARLVYVIDPLGDVTMNTYDAAGNLITVCRYAKPITGTKLDALAATCTAANVSAAVSADSTNDRIERRVYDSENRLVYSIDALGDPTMFTYDGTGKVVASRRYTKAITSYPSTMTVSTVAAKITADTANDRIERRVYDADNRLRYVIDAAGNVQETVYDAIGQVSKTVQYGVAIGTGTAATLTAVSGALWATGRSHVDDRTTSFTYDTAGRVLSTNDARGFTESYEYDGLGNKIKFTNKLNKIWNYSYDAQGHLLTETDPAVDLTRISIDAAGAMTSSVGWGVQLVTSMTYTAFGQLASRTEATGQPEQRVTSYEYDRLGHQVKTTFPQVVAYGQANPVAPYSQVTYDTSGNAVKNCSAGGNVSANYSYKVYDAAGQVRFEVDASGYVTGYARNAFGEVTALTRYAGTFTVTAGQPPSLTQLQNFASTGDHSADRVITTTYDAAGRVVKVKEPEVTAYDSAHALSTPTNSFTAGKATATVYNAFGEVLKQSVYGETGASTAKTAADITFYTYNVLGQRTAQIDVSERLPSATSSTGYLTTFGYDAFGNLNDRIEYADPLTFADSGFKTQTGMTWSVPTKATNRSNADYKREIVYVYDKANNKISETRKSILFSTTLDGATPTEGDARTAYAYDAVGNLISTTDVAGTTTYTYRDALGHVRAVATVPIALKNEQIAQVFVGLVNRAPDSGALSYYPSYSLTDIARMALRSTEGQPARDMSQTSFVTSLYSNLLGRTPDSASLSQWVSRLQTLETPMPSDPTAAAETRVQARAQLLVELVASVRDASGQDAAVMNGVVKAALSGGSLVTAKDLALRRVQISQVYVAVLGRVADPGGLVFYQSSAVTASMAQNFFNSPEGQLVFPSGTSNQELATRLYQNIFGHAPTDATLSTWISKLPANRSTGMGQYILDRIKDLATTGTASEIASFNNKVMAGLPEAMSANGNPGGLTEFQVDAYGNVNVRADFASGAEFALSPDSGVAMPYIYGKTASANDRITYTEFDSSGHATAVIDANGKAAFTDYDVFGRVVRQSRTVTAADGAKQTAYQQWVYDGIGRVTEVDEPGVAHKTAYNAFGEVTSRSINSDAAFETNVYDNAGHLVRTNAGDGVVKVFLFDVFGNETVQVKSAVVDLNTYSGPILTAADGQLVRTYLTYDLDGNVITQKNSTQFATDVGSVNGSVYGSAAVTSMRTASVDAPTIVAHAESLQSWETKPETGEVVPGPMYWDGTNKVSLSWASLAGLGAGDVRVELTCSMNTDAYNPTVIGTRSITQDFPADQALTGATIEWDAAGGALVSVNQVKIYKKNTNGDWSLIADRSSWGTYGSFLRVDLPADLNSTTVFEYRLTGTTAWIDPATSQFGDALLFDASSLAAGTYDYRVMRKKATETVLTQVDVGTFVPGSTLTSSTSGATTAGVAPTINRTYDRWGNVRTQTDARNSAWVTSYTYNANNQVTSTSNDDGVTSAYYDILGRQVATKDACGNVNAQVYDALGHLVEELHADGGTIQYRVDVFGQKLQVRQADGEISSYTYDKLGRMTSVKRAVGVGVNTYTTSGVGGDNAALVAGTVQFVPQETYIYDELGRRIQTTDAAGHTRTNYYDLRGNVASTDTFGRLTGYIYDAYNHKTSQTQGGLLTESWTYDAWGHVLTHTDLAATGSAGTKHTFTYGKLQQVTGETSTAGQNVVYTYDNSSGLLVKIEDKSAPGYAKVTQYAYDEASNHTREKASTVRLSDGVETDVVQDNHIAYDAMGRQTDIRDARYVVHYDYDANGNRVHQTVHYLVDTSNNSGVDAPPRDVDAWSKFDVMNREIVVDGVMGSSNNIDIDLNGIHQGTRIGYDAAGNRIWSRQWGAKLSTSGDAIVTESYFYDAAGRLTDTWREGYHADARYYDQLGRVLQSGAVGLSSIDADRLTRAGVSLTTQMNEYFDDNQLRLQTLKSSTGMTHMDYRYDEAGRLQIYYLISHNGPAYANGYEYIYNANDANAVTTINGYNMGNGLATRTWRGSTIKGYDANGYLVHTEGSGTSSGAPKRDLVNDFAGRVLRKTEATTTTIPSPYGSTQKVTTHVTTTLIANGEVIGAASDAGAPDSSTFANDYTPINDQSLEAGPTAYTVQAGDTLQSIAKRLWGNANLWYVIAEANPAADFAVGTIITIPAKPNTEYADYQTFDPYDPDKAVGNTTPTVPPPPPKKASGFAKLIVLVVAVVATILTAGAAAIAMGSTLGPWAAGLAAIAGEGVGALAATVIGSAVGSAASQVVGIGLGVQNSFSWKQVGLSALSAGLAAGVSEAIPALAGAETWKVAARAAVANAATQGIGVVTGLQRSFDWRGVAASAVGAGIGQAAGVELRAAWGGTPMGNFAARAVTGLVAGIAAAVMRGGKVAIQQVATDAFGNALGESIAYQSSSAGAPAQNTPFPDQLRAGAELPDMADIAALNAQITAGEAPDVYPGVQVADASGKVSVGRGPIVHYGRSDGTWVVEQVPNNIDEFRNWLDKVVDDPRIGRPGQGTVAGARGAGEISSSVMYQRGYGDIRETVTPIFEPITVEVPPVVSAVIGGVGDVATGAIAGLADMTVAPVADIAQTGLRVLHGAVTGDFQPLTPMGSYADSVVNRGAGAWEGIKTTGANVFNVSPLGMVYHAGTGGYGFTTAAMNGDVRTATREGIGLGLNFAGAAVVSGRAGGTSTVQAEIDALRRIAARSGATSDLPRTLTRDQWKALNRADRVARDSQSWSTARQNVWKNIGETELNSPTGKYSDTNIARMLEGLAPRTRVEVQLRSGRIVERDVSVELHHRSLPQRLGTQTAHEPWNLEPAYPWSHAGMDPYRFTGYDLLRILRGPNSY